MKTIVLILLVAVISSGCCSYVVYKGSEKQLLMKKAMVMNDERAIRGIKLGEDGAGIGIDLANTEVLMERPWMQLGGALLDIAGTYALKKGVDSLNDKPDPKPQAIIKGDNNTVVIVNGDNNSGNGNPDYQSDNVEMAE